MKQSPEERPDNPKDLIGIGKKLRLERERQQLSRYWIARQLHLQEKMIVALEQEDFDAFPAPVFVKGNLRAFARILGLDEQSILQPYNASSACDKPMALTKKPRKTRFSIQPSIAAGCTVVVVLLMTLTWYFVYPRSIDTPEPHANNWSAISVAEATTGQALKAVELFENLVVLEFTADSWVKVRDKSGKNVLKGMMPQGTMQVLSGQLPYEITLANSAGVRILKNGRMFDFSHHIKGNVAHFILSAEKE